jgi:hypothetical protein
MTTEQTNGASSPSFSSAELERHVEQRRRGIFTKLTGKLASMEPQLYKMFCLGTRGDVVFKAFEEGRKQERERITTELSVALALEDFGCACEPTYQCGTCKARDILDKALGPLLRELRSNANVCGLPHRKEDK